MGCNPEPHSTCGLVKTCRGDANLPHREIPSDMWRSPSQGGAESSLPWGSGWAQGAASMGQGTDGRRHLETHPHQAIQVDILRSESRELGHPVLWGHPLASVLVAPGHMAGLYPKRMRGSRVSVCQEMGALEESSS